MKHFLSVLLLTLMPLLSTAQTTDLSAMEGTWTGKLKVGFMQLTLVFHLNKDTNQKWQCTLDSPDQGATDIPAVVNHIAADSLSIGVPAIGVTYCAHVQDDTMQGTFSQMGQALPLKMQKKEEKINRPQEPRLPLPYPTEEVQFENTTAGATFSGTLSLPQGFTDEQAATTPVVIMVTGSGQQNRNEEIFGHKPFFVIADYLARNGIATLRYDDRAFGRSVGGDVKNATTADFADDAKAGINYLRNVRKFNNIGIIGHSEGANIAFMAGADGLVDFVISMAAIGVRGDEALTAQVNDIMKRSGMSATQTVESYRQQVKLQHNAWLDYFIDYDPAPHIAATRCPVMAVNGENDCQVVCALNLNAIKTALPANKKNLLKSYKQLNHLFQHSNSGLPTEYRQIEETIADEVVKDIADWIKSL